MEAFVWDLYSIIDALHIEKPVICGLSMGGYISLRAVEKEEDR
jgi:pimeloyl-ACP methyl ester carboxylesterase